MDNGDDLMLLTSLALILVGVLAAFLVLTWPWPL
jgi:hypothetical protein